MKHLGAWLVVPLLAVGVGAAGREGSLTEAAKSGNHTLLSALLGQRVDVNAAEPDGTTALHWAVQRDDSKAVDLLIRAGANVRAANRYQATPLYVACVNGNAAIIEKLLQAGADANAASLEGERAIMTAARTGKVDAVKVLLAHGADVNAKEESRGQTALMWAAAGNHPAAARALIDARADIHARSNGGFTSLLFAARAGSLEALKVLVDAGASVDDAIRPMSSQPAAASPPGERRGAQPTGALPVSAPPGVSSTARGGQVDNRPQPLTRARAFDTGLRGARMGPGGTSALVLAITNAHFELAAYLLDKGADGNRDAQGWTPLHQLAWTRRPPIQHGLPPAVPTGNMSSLDLGRKLLESGADPNARMTKEPNDGARNVLNRIGSTPFLQAAKLADVPYMRLLVEYGADPSITTEEGATPMMAAAGVGIWHVGEAAGTNLEAFEAVKLTYELGNDVNAVDANGDTALHGAAFRGANEVVRFLVEKGGKLDVVDSLGWTPWIIADGVFYPNTYNRQLETAALLVKLGANTKVGKRRPEDLPPGEVEKR